MSRREPPASAPPPDAAPAPPRRLTFPRRLRILRRADFERLLRSGLRLGDSRLTLWVAENGRPHARLGLMVRRKHGDAPTRNRIKRCLRAAFRLVQHELAPGLDLLCAPRDGLVVTEATCRDSLLRLAARASRKLADRS